MATFLDFLVVVSVPMVVVSAELAPMVVEPEPLLVVAEVVPALCGVDVPDWAAVSDVVPAVAAGAAPGAGAVPVPPALVAAVPPAVVPAVAPVAAVPAVPLVPALTPAAPVADVPALVPVCDQAKPKVPANAAAMTVSVSFLWIEVFMNTPVVGSRMKGGGDVRRCRRCRCGG